jgi:hypothetical protein
MTDKASPPQVDVLVVLNTEFGKATMLALEKA